MIFVTHQNPIGLYLNIKKMGKYHFITIEEKKEGVMLNMGTIIEKISMAINTSPMDYLVKAKAEGRKIALLYTESISKTDFDRFQ